MKNTVYAITDQRAIVFIGRLFSTSVRSFYPEDLDEMECKEKSNGVGKIQFEPGFFASPQQKPGLPCGFFNIPHVKQVERLLKDLAAKATADEEDEELQKEPDDFADPPIMSLVGPVPRNLSLPLQFYLRFCSGHALFVGWIFAVVGLTIILGICTSLGLDDIVPRSWSDAGTAKITQVLETSTMVNDDRILAYHFQATDTGAENVSGVSYGRQGKHKVDDEVALQRAGNRYRIKGLNTTKGGMASLFGMAFCSVFVIVGLAFPAYSWHVGSKSARLLSDGEPAKAIFVDMNPTGTVVNNAPVMKVNFKYRVDGQEYTTSANAVDPSRLIDDDCEVVFYNPMNPEQAIVWDGLPKGVYFDESSNCLTVNPFRCLLPLLCVTVITVEFLAILFCIIRAI